MNRKASAYALGSNLFGDAQKMQPSFIALTLCTSRYSLPKSGMGCTTFVRVSPAPLLPRDMPSWYWFNAHATAAGSLKTEHL